MFETLIVQPIFNLLVLVYALIPGHNFGLSIIVFTIIIRLVMWPLFRKQLHHTKAMRDLQPEIKRIKKEAAGNRQKESVMLMELYKERQINPLAPLGILVVQFIVLIGLYQGLRRVVSDPHALINHAYPALRHLPWMKTLAADISRFDGTLFGVINLTRAAINPGGGYYFPALFLVIGSAVTQYFQSVQLLPSGKDSRKLRAILKDASSGRQADQGEINAAVSRSTRYFIPLMIFFFTVGIASALSLYWFTGGLVAYIQQRGVLKQDETELLSAADNIIEGEVVETSKPNQNVKKSPQQKRHKRKKRR